MQCGYHFIVLACVFMSGATFDDGGWVVDDTGCLTPQFEPGDCVEQKYCDFILASINNADSSEKVRSIVNEYTCGVDMHGHPKVCCPFKHSAVYNSDFTDHSHHKNVKLLPVDCGDVQAWGLDQGNASNLFEFPWPTLLRYKKHSDYLCGASLISARYILTAAHCISDDLYEAVLGEYEVTTSIDCTQEYQDKKVIDICRPHPQFFAISKTDAIKHIDYDPRTFSNDIALIRLRRKVDTFSETIKPICLPITSKQKEEKYTKYTVIGWGADENGLASTILVKKITQKVDNSICNSNRRVLAKKQICIEDSCASDEGGLVMGYYDDGDRLKTIQYGILTFRPSSCDDADVPGAYTDITGYMGWILDNIKP